MSATEAALGGAVLVGWLVVSLKLEQHFVGEVLKHLLPSLGVEACCFTSRFPLLNFALNGNRLDLVSHELALKCMSSVVEDTTPPFAVSKVLLPAWVRVQSVGLGPIAVVAAGLADDAELFFNGCDVESCCGCVGENVTDGLG